MFSLTRKFLIGLLSRVLVGYFPTLHWVDLRGARCCPTEVTTGLLDFACLAVVNVIKISPTILSKRRYLLCEEAIHRTARLWPRWIAFVVWTSFITWPYIGSRAGARLMTHVVSSGWVITYLHGFTDLTRPPHTASSHTRVCADTMMRLASTAPYFCFYSRIALVCTDNL